MLPFEKNKAMIPRVKRLALARAAKMAQRHFLDSFKKQGFTDRALRRWDRRKAPTGRGILIGEQARLKKSVQIRGITGSRAKVGTSGIVYAAIHNEGGVTHPSVTKKMRAFAWAKYKQTGNPKYKHMALTEKTELDVKIPKRQFVGESEVLRKATERMIQKEFLKLFKP